MNRVLVCGGELGITDELGYEIEKKLVHQFGGQGFMFVLGDVCTPAEKWAYRQGVRVEFVSHPKWRAQNRRQLLLGADLVVAFIGGIHREHMVEAARAAGVEVWEPSTWVKDDQSVKYHEDAKRPEYQPLIFEKNELEVEGVEEDTGPMLIGGKIHNWK